MIQKRPNFLFIIADQHNARMLGAAGDKVAKTPNLDRIADRGVMFEQAYCVNPICSPSRISIYTGKEPAHHGFYGNMNWAIEDDCPEFLPTQMKNNGYQTALVGRGHMVYKWDHEGFDQVSYMNFGDCDRYCLEDNPWLMQLIENNAADNYDISLPCNTAFTSSMPVEYSEEMWMARTARDFLQNRDKEKPFYLHVGYDHPHPPIAPPAEFDKMFSADMIELPDNCGDTFEGKPEQVKEQAQQRQKAQNSGEDKQTLKEMVAKQYALVNLVDNSIGKIIDELEQQGELDNTIIIYTADHGDFAGEHGMVKKNIGIYESVHRVPCLISWPKKFNVNIKVQKMIETVDLYPTILEHAGIDAPESDGRNLTEMLQGKGEGREHVICDWENIRAIRTEDYRLVEYDEQSLGELYNLNSDPGEMNNLWEDEAYQQVKNELLKKLHQRTLADKHVCTSRVEEMTSEPERVQKWFKEDSPIYAMWKYGLKWSQIKTYLEDRPQGGVRLTCPVRKLAEKYPFTLPEIK